MVSNTARSRSLIGAVAVALTALLVTTSSAGASADSDGGETPSTPLTLNVATVISGTQLHHAFTTTGTTVVTEALKGPDDVTQLDNTLVTGFQNGVGAQGEPSASGNLYSTIVQFSPSGNVIGQWEVKGRADGVTAYPALDAVVVTVNEDAGSALYLIRPEASTGVVTEYNYNVALPHFGGTDAISIVDGKIFVTASGPGTLGGPSAPSATFPAVYALSLNESTLVATITPVFYEEDVATVANVNLPQNGQQTLLGLSDPDSTSVVPRSSHRFKGDFMVTSQGDLQQIFVDHAGEHHQHLSVLILSQAIDDAAWTTSSSGALYATDTTNNAVDIITGRLHRGQMYVVAAPCKANAAPANCPAPPTFPANYLALENLFTGTITPVTLSGVSFTPKGGLTFVSGQSE